MFYVYKITNIVNGKFYIGKTYNIKVRFLSHKTAANRKNKKDYSYIHRAMNKYGHDKFIIETLFEFENEKESLEKEIECILLFNSTDKNIGYNLTKGGDGVSGYKPTIEQRLKMSIQKKTGFLAEKNPFYGKVHSEKSKQKISEKNKLNHKNNIQKYNDLNIKQCKLTKEQCLEIQQDYIDGLSYIKIAEKRNVNLNLINKIIYGKYAVIKNHSILNEDIINDIKNTINSEKKSKISLNQESCESIINLYKSGLNINQISEQLNFSRPTISKYLKLNNIVIEKQRGVNFKNRSSISEDVKMKIINYRVIEKMSYKDIAAIFNISVDIVNNTIKRLHQSIIIL